MMMMHVINLLHVTMRYSYRCGYVLQPKCLNDPAYDPFDKGSLTNVKPMVISLIVSACILSDDT